ncbi:MAG: GNAT family N-acetyltransferase [Oscillospiraceae bacterium]|nr:GNAT family N-acetyltransferase [Oscillospiraceae bacterium]
MKKLFDEIPYLSDERIVLRRLSAADLPALREMITDERVYRYLPTFLFEQQYDDLDRMLEELYGQLFASKESLILAVERKADGAFCGLAEFYGFKDSLQKTCIGYRLRQDRWGCGIATAAVALMVGYLFEQTDTEIITASTMIENQASARVLEKNGFIRTARAVPEDWGYPQPTIADKWFR